MVRNSQKMKILIKNLNGFKQEKTQDNSGDNGNNGRHLKSYLRTEIFGINYKEEHYLISRQTLNGNDSYNVFDTNYHLIHERHIKDKIISRFNEISNSIKKEAELRIIQSV